MSTQIDIVISDYFTDETYTGWKMTKVVNNILVNVGCNPIPPQMIYQYISKGYIKSVNKRVMKEVAIEWTEGYITRKLTK